MKKALGQTVRDLKRGVNKKVLKVPSIEQKVLDATSNEPWGPHGALLAEIAQATRNYHEYQMIMSVIWKRTNDTGKNWRHVYKALTVLEYLVAHGSERVIDDIREHAYQISTLSDFQYIDSSAKDQGNNVRKKSQSLVVLVNDKERIQEVRQKAAANREKYRNTPVGSMYRPGSSPSSGDRYDDDSGNRDDDRNSYGREREWGSRDDDRYGRDGDRYSRDNEERYGRDGYRDDDNRGRGQSADDYNYESRSRSADRDRNSLNDDDGQYSSRGSGAKADDHSQDGSSTGRNLGVPPSYEDAVGASRSPPYSDRDGDSSEAYAPKASSPTGASPSLPSTAVISPPAPASPPASAQYTTQHSNELVDGFDEFDPRGSFSAASTTSNGAAPATEMDLLGSLSESFSPNSFAPVPTSHPSIAPEANASSDFSSGPTVVAAPPESMINNQPFDDPFGDGPFQAVLSPNGASTEQQITNSFNSGSNQSLDAPQPTEFGGPFYDAMNYMPSGPSDVQSPPTSNTEFVQQEFSNPNQDFDILADILPPSGPSSFVNNSQGGYPAVPPNQYVSHGGFPQTNQLALSGQNAQPNSFQAQDGLPGGFPTQLQPSSQASYPHQPAESVSQTGFPTQTMALTYPGQAGQASQMGFQPQSGTTGQPNPNFYGTYTSQSASMGPAAAYTVPPNPNGGPTSQLNFLSQSGSSVPTAAQMGPQSNSLVAPVLINPSSIGSSAIVAHSSQDKFQTKSTVWADTLSRGLVNLNISGSKTNPLSDIGVDFDAINRKEKRMEKPTTATVTSTVTMGKAMGSGSGIGRAGATVLRPTQNQMMGSGMNGGPGGGMGMGGYGGNQPVGRGMGMGMNMPGNMGMGMNMPGNMGMGMNMHGNMGMGMNMPGNIGNGMNMPGNMGMGMGMGMNMPGNMGMGMNMGMGQGANMQPRMGVPPGSTMPGANNHMMGTGNYGQQPYGGGYR